jgi:hypothetical protein
MNVASDAFEIVKLANSHSGLPYKFRDAYFLAKFSFPLEQKLEIINKEFTSAMIQDRSIYSLMWFRETFQEAETTYQKGPQQKEGSMEKIRDIINGI